jgi:hypothetical protein
MGTNIYNSLANIVLLATISSSVISLSYDSDNLIPKMNHNYSFQNNIPDWNNLAFNQSVDYKLQDESMEKLQTIMDFSKKVIQNTKDIDSEFVDIVNDNFWELI